MKINDAPPIAMHIIKITDNPSGIGEVGMTAAFRSLGNALFNATGKKCKRYPFSPHFCNGEFGSI